jgi:hypothetical protein
MPLRLALWLTTLATLVFPAAMMARHAVAAHGQSAHAPQEAGAMPDCHDPAPPPCPDEGTAKHAAATCCPIMSGTVAVMPDEQPTGGRVEIAGAMPSRPTPLSGLTYCKDPPPPRA